MEMKIRAKKKKSNGGKKGKIGGGQWKRKTEIERQKERERHQGREGSFEPQ